MSGNVVSKGFVSLVGAGPGDPELWTVRALRRVQDADLVLYDALVDAGALQQLTKAQCFCVGKRAGRASVKQETIHRLMIRAARAGKCVVRLNAITFRATFHRISQFSSLRRSEMFIALGLMKRTSP